MQMKLLVIVFALLCSTGMMGQRKVVHISTLPENAFPGIVPDAKGWVLIDTSSQETNWYIGKTVDTITPFPLWPLSRQGSNERGGIFANIDSDQELEIIYTIGQQIHAFKKSGWTVNGWPKDLLLYPDGAPSFGDIDGDGFGEIVVTTRTLGSFTEGYLYAFEMNGVLRPGFPKLINGGAVRTPVLADLDGDGSDEIIIAVRDYPDGFIYVYTGNGQLFPGWPVRLDDVPATAVAVGDINGDNIPEIVCESYVSMSVFTPDGLLVTGFPYFPGNDRVLSNSSPVLADIDGDGQREIIFGDHASSQGNGKIYIVKNDGTDYPGWPKQTSSWIYSPPSVGDINGDGNLDIVVADYFHGTTPNNRLYAWDAQTGNPLPGFPVANVYGAFSQALLADLDSDGDIEIMIDANIGPVGQYLAFHHDGTPLDAWPVTVNGTTFTINPMILDIDGDGILDISGGGYDPLTEKTNIYLWNGHADYVKENMILTMLQYNTRHNGVYGDYLMVGTALHPAPPEENINIRPNPVKSGKNAVLSIGGTGEKNIGIHWSDPSGRKIFYEKRIMIDGSVTISVPGTTPGVYLLGISMNNVELPSRKVIITE